MSKTTKLQTDEYSEPIQAFPLSSGKVNITSAAGAIRTELIHCVEDGSFTALWQDGTSATIACVVGDDYSLLECASVTIVGGTFHLG